MSIPLGKQISALYRLQHPLDAETNKNPRTRPWCAPKTAYLQQRVYTVCRSSRGTWVAPAY